MSAVKATAPGEAVLFWTAAAMASSTASRARLGSPDPGSLPFCALNASGRAIGLPELPRLAVATRDGGLSLASAVLGAFPPALATSGLPAASERETGRSELLIASSTAARTASCDGPEISTGLRCGRACANCMTAPCSASDNAGAPACAVLRSRRSCSRNRRSDLVSLVGVPSSERLPSSRNVRSAGRDGGRDEFSVAVFAAGCALVAGAASDSAGAVAAAGAASG